MKPLGINYTMLRHMIGLLDQHDPHWYKRVDIEKLPRAERCNCIFCQLYGASNSYHNMQDKYGDFGIEAYNTLDADRYIPFWTDAILIRLHPDRDLSPAACKQGIAELLPEQLSQPVIEETAWCDDAERNVPKFAQQPIVDPMYEPMVSPGDFIMVPGWEKKGTKYDDGKIRTDLMKPEALLGLAEVLTFGAKKYGDRNWEQGIDYSRVYAAALRHLLAWFKGEDNDDETGMSHLDHAACCIHFLQTFTKDPSRYQAYDNRPV